MTIATLLVCEKRNVDGAYTLEEFLRILGGDLKREKTIKNSSLPSQMFSC